jgi:hypothetical protein
MHEIVSMTKKFAHLARPCGTGKNSCDYVHLLAGPNNNLAVIDRSKRSGDSPSEP